MIAIVDYGAGNLRSVAKAIAWLGYPAVVTSDAAEIERADAVILPGVGAAGDMMCTLTNLRLVEPLREAIAAGKPYLGICLGLQALLTASEEGGWQRCLDVTKGVVRRFPPGLHVPQMGWNQVRQLWPHPIFEGIPDLANFYFLHSYYADPEDRSIVAGETEYSVTYVSVLAFENVVAVQFHPEKSGQHGLRLLDNFCRWAGQKATK